MVTGALYAAVLIPQQKRAGQEAGTWLQAMWLRVLGFSNGGSDGNQHEKEYGN